MKQIKERETLYIHKFRPTRYKSLARFVQLKSSKLSTIESDGLEDWSVEYNETFCAEMWTAVALQLICDTDFPSFFQSKL